MIIITGSVTLKPERREEAIALGLEHSQRSRTEPGCISHDCYITAGDPNRMHFFERWADAEAMKRHFAVPESGAFIRAVGAMASTPPEIAIYTAEEVEGAPF
ncbi:putative quinol monooxygenase [Altererythrobacter arenosus]|uniref:Quinol monooxygenase n=1 Tax=Altererythrobacter arenosus TaxID=3032592 RepID=A0ABY8FSH1_9SPHN|nr:putative quinol monooxygenase [Altererythrobacter sp. CAU 1644]WFL77030.1 putative quinol monooxygenase [Altererythrobacter sp. CAU 1644]